MTTTAEIRRLAAFADRLRSYYGGELPEGANITQNFVGAAIVSLPLGEMERLLDRAEAYGLARQRLDGERVERRETTREEG